MQTLVKFKLVVSKRCGGGFHRIYVWGSLIREFPVSALTMVPVF